MWEKLLEASSVLPSMKQNVPSNRSDVGGTQGIGDRSDVGKKPWEGQAKLLGNLNGQSRGFQGTLDLQGKNEPELFTSHRGSTKSNDPGTYTPPKYKAMYNQRINESANGSEMGIQAGKHKTSAAAGKYTTGLKNKYVPKADTRHGGSCNCGKSSTLSEGQLLGGLVSFYGMNFLLESIVNSVANEG